MATGGAGAARAAKGFGSGRRQGRRLGRGAGGSNDAGAPRAASGDCAAASLLKPGTPKGVADGLEGRRVARVPTEEKGAHGPGRRRGRCRRRRWGGLGTGRSVTWGGWACGDYPGRPEAPVLVRWPTRAPVLAGEAADAQWRAPANGGYMANGGCFGLLGAAGSSSGLAIYRRLTPPPPKDQRLQGAS